MSRIAVRNALSKFRDGYFRLEINQRLYVNAMIMLFIAFIVSAIFKPRLKGGINTLSRILDLCNLLRPNFPIQEDLFVRAGKGVLVNPF